VSPFVEHLIARLPTRDTRPPDDGRRRAGVAAVIHDDPTGPRVLMMKRIERVGDPWSGHISLPGGGYQAGDGDLKATAIRETAEELGVELGIEPRVRYVGPLPMLSPLTGGPNGVEVTPFVFASAELLATNPGPEAVSAFWLPLELAASGKLDAEYTYPGTARTFPSWSYEGHTIWGLTWRILGDLLAIGRAA
jgi:8-oxo-dGTP pyrophosphatase MutT (NUDIX family)